MEAVKILVNGLLEVDSGKTVMAYSLIKALGKEGFKVAPFKPIGAVDLWRSSWVLREIEESGKVLSGDAVVLNSASSIDIDIERTNPVALILSPIDPGRLNWSQAPYQSLMTSLSKRSSLLRLTLCKGSLEESYHYLNLEALSRSTKKVREELESVVRRLKPKAKEVSDRDVEKLIRSSVAYAESCYVPLLKSAEVIVIESHDDTAVPIPSAIDVDIVVSVAPGKAGILKGKKFKDAISVLASIGTMLTLNTREILNITGVSGELDLPLLNYPLEEGYPNDILKEIIDLVKGVIKK